MSRGPTSLFLKPGSFAIPGTLPSLAQPPLPWVTELQHFAEGAWPIISHIGDTPSAVLQEEEAL